MKKYHLPKLCLMGISAGLLITGCQKGKDAPSSTSAAEQMAPDMKAFYDSLSSDAQKKFDALDAKHKAMAMDMVEQGCGKSGCKGGTAPTSNEATRAVETQYNNQQNNL